MLTKEIYHGIKILNDNKNALRTIFDRYILSSTDTYVISDGGKMFKKFIYYYKKVIEASDISKLCRFLLNTLVLIPCKIKLNDTENEILYKIRNNMARINNILIKNECTEKPSKENIFVKYHKNKESEETDIGDIVVSPSESQ